ncbi:MAG: hypothetical protein QMC96_12170 [Methanomicrobiales archaeon]|nr:hypothetical protein [Methanomicrobiales archaeon]
MNQPGCRPWSGSIEGAVWRLQIGTPDPDRFQAALASTWDVRVCLAGREIPRDIRPRDLQPVNPCHACGAGSCTCKDGGGRHPAPRR